MVTNTHASGQALPRSSFQLLCQWCLPFDPTAPPPPKKISSLQQNLGGKLYFINKVDCCMMPICPNTFSLSQVYIKLIFSMPYRHKILTGIKGPFDIGVSGDWGFFTVTKCKRIVAMIQHREWTILHFTQQSTIFISCSKKKIYASKRATCFLVIFQKAEIANGNTFPSILNA